MKKKNLFPFTVLILSLIFLSGLKDIEAKAVGVKDIEHDINSVINSFFALRDASNSYSVDDKTVGDVNNDGAIFSIKKSLKISNDALSTFLSDYHKLRKIIANESNIQEDIVTSKITKNIIEQNNEIIVDVNRYKESYYTVNHVKNDYLTYESSDYRFVFSKDTGELIDYIPGDMEEKTLMKSASMDRIIESEHTLRNKLKIKEDTQSVHRANNTINGQNLTIPYAYSVYSFNRANMLNYAIQYAFNYNPAYGDFSTLGGDCTNFVSQIIRVCDY